jgi:phage/plasmid-like protein (TIGR03299 family)
MAHEIDSTNAVYTDQQAWHRIGTEIPRAETFADELRAVRDVMPVLFSEYDEYDAFIVTSDPTFVGGKTYTVKNGGAGKPCRIAPVPDVKAIVRRQDGRVMRRTVGAESFYLRQPADLWQRAEAFARNAPNAHLSFAAYLYQGSRLFVCLDLGSVEINGEEHQRYLTLVTGFDGSKAEEVILSVQRAVCANTVAVARYDAQSDDPAKAYFKTKHTKYADRRIRKADLEIAKVLEQFGFIQRQLEALPRITVDPRIARDLISECLERTGRFDTASDSPKARAKSVIDEILDLYEDPRADHAKWHGTANGVYQAVTAYWSHHSTVRGARSAKSGTTRSPAARTRLTEYAYDTGAKSVMAASEVMAELVEHRGITLEEAGVHVGEQLDGSGTVAAKVI